MTVWCGIAASVIIGSFFLEDQSTDGPVKCTMTAARLESMLRCLLIPKIQQRGILDTSIFVQDGAQSYISTRVKQILKQHFRDDRIIDRRFPIYSSPWLLDSQKTPAISGFAVTSKEVLMVIA